MALIKEIRIYPISIHAPARGQTWDKLKPDRELCISIHAPARGQTGTQITALPDNLFQFTPPRGGKPRHPDHGAA